MNIHDMTEVAYKNGYEAGKKEAQDEIEKLTVELVGMRGACESYKMHYENAQAEKKELWEERNRIYESLKETKADLEEYRKAYLNAQTENESLQEENEVMKTNCNSMCMSMPNISKAERTEAIKEFAKRFERKIKNVQVTLGQTWEIQNALKDTLKEMTEQRGEGI